MKMNNDKIKSFDRNPKTGTHRSAPSFHCLMRGAGDPLPAANPWRTAAPSLHCEARVAEDRPLLAASQRRATAPALLCLTRAAADPGGSMADSRKDGEAGRRRVVTTGSGRRRVPFDRQLTILRPASGRKDGDLSGRQQGGIWCQG